MFENQNPNYVRFFTVNEDKWERLQTNTPKGFALQIKRELPGRRLKRLQTSPEFALESFGKMDATLSFVVLQSLFEILLERRVKLDSHQGRRRTPAQNVDSVSGCSWPLSSSASRRAASTRISVDAAASGGGGRLPRM